MNVPAHSATRPKQLDLVRRAKLLGVTHGHLSRVLSGKRESQSLLLRFNNLIEHEAASRKIEEIETTTAPNPRTTK